MGEQRRTTGTVLVVVLGVVFVAGVVVLALVRPDILGLQAPAGSEPAVSTAAEPEPAVEPAGSTTEPAAQGGAASEPSAAGEPAGTAAVPAGATPSATTTTSTGALQAAYDIATRTNHPPLRERDAYVKWAVENLLDEEKYAQARFDRAAEAVARQDIMNDRVHEAFLRTPRHEFSRPRGTLDAYGDLVLALSYGQTMSGPHLQSRMTSFLDPQPEQRVLEIGTGSGVQAAYLAELSNHVYTIEIVPQLAAETDEIYKGLIGRYPEFQNVHRMENDGYYGWPEYAPFDRIIVTCGIDHIPPDLLKQLAVGGIMVIPVGPPGGQTVMKVTKTLDATGNEVIEREDIYAGKRKVVFVPFTAKGGGVHSTGATEP